MVTVSDVDVSSPIWMQIIDPGAGFGNGPARLHMQFLLGGRLTWATVAWVLSACVYVPCCNRLAI